MAMFKALWEKLLKGTHNCAILLPEWEVLTRHNRVPLLVPVLTNTHKIS